MKLAIHKGGSWNARWRDYCSQNNISFLEVDCHSFNIIETLKKNEITHLLWHLHHASPADILMARNVLYASKYLGIATFPDFDTCWHFDDKISQKYLLEAVGANLVPSYAFFNKKDALNWLKSRKDFPVVAKLRRGAGSYNVKLLTSYQSAKGYINVMFGKGVAPTPGLLADTSNKLRVAGNIRGIFQRLKKLPGFLRMINQGRQFPREKGYVYFQDFVPDNKTDLRVAVVGDHIWAFRRQVRKGDFRASGSGVIIYENLDIPVQLIKELHQITKKIGAKSLAYDLLMNTSKKFLIVEVSYGYSGDAIYNGLGYWNGEYEFVYKKLYPEEVILNNFIRQL